MNFCHLGQSVTLQNFTLWYGMVVWWLCWHRTILIRNITQKQYSQFPPVHDFGKPWWGVAYVPCMTNLPALYAWVIRCHVTCMLSLPNTGRVDVHCPIMSVLTQSYQCGTWFVCSILREFAVSNLCQPLFCLSITWSRCRNAYQDLWIMTIRRQVFNGLFFLNRQIKPSVFHRW